MDEIYEQRFLKVFSIIQESETIVDATDLIWEQTIPALRFTLKQFLNQENPPQILYIRLNEEVSRYHRKHILEHFGAKVEKNEEHLISINLYEIE